MDETPILKIPYAEGTDPADAPALSEAMAEKIEELLLDIPLSQLDDGVGGQIIVVQGTGQAAYKAMSGDATIDAAGKLTIANLAVVTAKLADLAVTAAKLDKDSVLTEKIANLAVTAAKLANESVENSKIKNEAVGTTKLANLAVTAAKIAEATITAAKIAENAIEAKHIIANAITTAKILDGAVTRPKLESIAKPVRWYTPKIINSEDFRKSAAFGLLGSGDVVEDVVVPSNNSIIMVLYTAQMRSEPGTPSGSGITSHAAIFLNGVQARVPDADNGTPILQEAVKGEIPGYFARLTSYWSGLNVAANNTDAAGPEDVATGQIISRMNPGGGISTGGPCYLFVNAGTYDVSVQYKSSNAAWGAGADNRKLWVGVMANGS